MRWLIRSLGLACWALLCSTCSLLDLLSPSSRSVPQARLIWRIAASPMPAPPAADDARVFFTAMNHRIVAVDRVTGAKLWDVPSDTGVVVRTGKLSFGGCVVAGELVVCGDNGDLLALHRSDGRFAWRFHPTVGPEADDDFAFADSTIYAGSRGLGSLYAVDSRTGELRWNVQVPNLVAGVVIHPLISDDFVFAAFVRSGKPMTGGVIAADRKSGTVRWRVELPQIPPDSDSNAGHIVVGDGLLFASSNSGRIFAIDPTSGAILWNVPGVGRDVPSSPLKNTRPTIFDSRAMLVQGTRLYSSSLWGWFLAYDIATHRELWRVDPQLSDGDGLPIFTDGKAAYILFLKGAVGILSLTDGHLVSVAGKNQLIGYTVTADQILATGDDGLYAFAKP